MPESRATGNEPNAMSGWPPRDIFAPFVLLAVSLERAHGYVIEDYLRALGIFGITMSTLYRTLRQMEKDGYLESTWEPGPTGPARRVYSLTESGRAWLDASASMLTAYRDTIDRFFSLYGVRPPAPAGEGPKPAEQADPKPEPADQDDAPAGGLRYRPRATRRTRNRSNKEEAR